MIRFSIFDRLKIIAKDFELPENLESSKNVTLSKFTTDIVLNIPKNLNKLYQYEILTTLSVVREQNLIMQGNQSPSLRFTKCVRSKL